MRIEDLPIEDRYGFHVFDGKDGKPFEPKLDSDEFRFPDSIGWAPIGGCPNCDEFFFGTIYRRKIDVGPEFELVPLDEPLRVGDEALDKCGRNPMTLQEQCWCIGVGSTPRGCLEKSTHKGFHAFRRRKLKEEKSDGRYVPKVGEMFTIKRWINSTDRSWVGSRLRAALAPDGFVKFEAYNRFSDSWSPTNTAYRLEELELQRWPDQSEIWNDYAKKKPSKAGRYLVFLPTMGVNGRCASNFNGQQFACSPQPSHWCEMPEPPAPEKTDAEKSLQEYSQRERVGYTEQEEKFYIAGFNAGRGK